jgi:hypothetical protein
VGEARLPAQVIVETLSVYLGPNTARNAVKTFAERSLGLAPEALTRGDCPRLLEALRPMLKTLLGAAQCDALLEKLSRELGP